MTKHRKGRGNTSVKAGEEERDLPYSVAPLEINIYTSEYFNKSLKCRDMYKVRHPSFCLPYCFCREVGGLEVEMFI